MNNYFGVKVSIITVCYNAVNYIEKSIESVINQTYHNIEYIIIDGGSSDGTQALIQRYKDKISYYISEPDKGISDAFNKGIKVANGDLIALLNADDYFNNDTVERVVNTYINSHYPTNTILHGDLKVIGDKRIKIEKPRSFKRFIFELPMWHPTAFFTRDIYQRYFYNTDYKIAMDYELLSRFYADEGSFVYIPHIINNMNDGGISNISARKGFKEVKKASKQNLKVNYFLAEIFYLYRMGLYTLMMIKRKLFN